MFEIWKEIIGYEGRYKISNLGNVHSMKTEDNLKLKTDIHGYCYVNLFDGLAHPIALAWVGSSRSNQG